MKECILTNHACIIKIMNRKGKTIISQILKEVNNKIKS